MSQPTGSFPWFSTEGKFAGSTRLILGFIIGALFALLPMYYFYMGREAALRGGNGSQPQPLPEADAPKQGAGRPGRSDSASKPFASRMTYELSQLPEELPPPQAKAPAAQVASAQPPRISAAPPPPVAAPPREEAVPTERVVNARPISAIPPDPRDTTREMEREARRPDYKELPAKQPSAKTAAPIAGRVIEGRDIEVKTVKPPPTPTPAAEKKPAEARTVIAERPAVAGATAMKPLAAPTPAAEKKPAEARTVIAERSAVAGATAIKPLPAPASAAEKKAAEARTVIAEPPSAAGATAIKPPEPAAAPLSVPPRFVVVTPSSAPPSSSGEPAVRDGVAGRIAATRDWLSAAPQTTHTIQLLGTNSEEHLKNQLKVLAKSLEPSKIYVFRTMAQGKPSMTVVYGAYTDRQSALQALEKLPPAVAANKPVLRTVNGIRAEMKQHKTDS